MIKSKFFLLEKVRNTRRASFAGLHLCVCCILHVCCGNTQSVTHSQLQNMSSFLFTGDSTSHSSSAHVQNHTEALASTQKHAGRTGTDRVRGLQLETVFHHQAKHTKPPVKPWGVLVVRVWMHWILFHIFSDCGGPLNVKCSAVPDTTEDWMAFTAEVSHLHKVGNGLFLQLTKTCTGAERPAHSEAFVQKLRSAPQRSACRGEVLHERQSAGWLKNLALWCNPFNKRKWERLLLQERGGPGAPLNLKTLSHQISQRSSICHGSYFFLSISSNILQLIWLWVIYPISAFGGFVQIKGQKKLCRRSSKMTITMIILVHTARIHIQHAFIITYKQIKHDCVPF